MTVPGPPVLWSLVQVAHLARRRLTQTLATAGVSGPQYGVMAALLDGDDLSSSDLARALLVRPQSMAGLVDSLVAAGMVDKQGPGGRGHRTTLALTAAGRETTLRLRRRLRSLDDATVTGLDDVQHAELQRLLALVSTALHDHETRPEP